jgi:hypothetical protein
LIMKERYDLFIFHLCDDLNVENKLIWSQRRTNIY